MKRRLSTTTKEGEETLRRRKSLFALMSKRFKEFVHSNDSQNALFILFQSLRDQGLHYLMQKDRCDYLGESKLDFDEFWILKIF